MYETMPQIEQPLPDDENAVINPKFEDGVETEQEQPYGEIEHPFDPEKIKVSTAQKTISLLLTRIEHEEIDLAPEFQRRARIWDNERKGRLIESLLLRIPLPVFYVASDEEENWSVVDGLQRLTTIYDFAKGEFPLRGLEYLGKVEGKKFLELPRNMQRRIEETELVINIIEPGTPEEVKFNIFKRINTGGLSLNGQEIRHALNKGPAREFLRELAESEAFRRATARSIGDSRMAARECALRFVAFWLMPWEEYKTNDLDGFLNAAMKRLNQMSTQDREIVKALFDRAMLATEQIFGNDAFRKRYAPEHSRKPVSKALLETWGVSIARLSDTDLSRLIASKDAVSKAFIDLMCSDRDFDVAISYATGVPQRVKKRFSAIRDLIQKVLS